MNKLFRTDLAGLKPPLVNVPMRQRMMCLNESFLDPFDVIREDFLNRMISLHLNRYFSDISDELAEALTRYAGSSLSARNIIWANGADDILYHIFMAVREGEQSFALSLAPSYFDYKTFSLAVGLNIRFLDLDEDFCFDSNSFVQKASDPNCRVAILCNPNNPTGNLFAEEQIRYIIEALPDTLLVLDETYFEFSGLSFVEYLEEYPNLILVRSFSKAFSAAGLRFGYAISNEYNIQELKKVFTTFHSSILNQCFALSILKHADVFQQQVRQVLQMRDQLYTALRELEGITVYTSATNFLSLKVTGGSSGLFEYLKGKDIAVRDIGSHPLLRDCLRVTVSSAEDNAALYNAIKHYLS